MRVLRGSSWRFCSFRGPWTSLRLAVIFNLTLLMGICFFEPAKAGAELNEQGRRALAMAWAPVIFHDVANEFTQPETGFNPVDQILNIDFDENEDLRDNAQSVFRLDTDQAEEAIKHPVLYYHLIETRSHIYINYMIYHAVDAGGQPHAHDSENLWTIIEKNGSPYGKLVAQISNAHGQPQIYSPEAETQWQWRMRVHRNPIKRVFMPALDMHSREHSMGLPEYVNRSLSRSLKIFVASKTHAIYKFSSQAWKSSELSGVVYIPVGCSECQPEVASLKSAVRTYDLIDWDPIINDKVDALMSGDEGLEDFLKVFAEIDSSKVRLSDRYRLKPLPENFAAGFGEEDARATLFIRSSLGTPSQLVDPASVHRFYSLKPRDVSSEYFYNPYVIESQDQARKFEVPLSKSASLFDAVADLFR